MTQTFLSSQTDEDFSKARNKAFINELQHFLNPDEAKLISFTDIKQLLKPQNEVYKGMQVVPIKLIVGSEGRYKDFDNHFFPKRNFLKNRWESVDMAHYKDIILPPIKVYELGGLYFVRDGNHRVSVAKMQGVEFIDAEVVSLRTEIKLKPDSTKSQMIRQVIEYEKRVFYAETNFGDITDYWMLNFSTPGQYDVIYNHILCHKYYINIGKPDEIPMEEAILSWFQNVYMPVLNVILKKKILKKFKKRTAGDLYVFIIKYWDELKQKFDDSVSIEEAAETFERDNKISFKRKVKNFLYKQKLLKLLKRN
ncbi:MAG: transcriptional regulator [Treponema sp.]|nr:transcriptional regulator [Treponema sp.]